MLHILAKLGLDVEASLLGENQEIAVVVAEGTFSHGPVGAVDGDGHALVGGRISGADHRLQALDEVDVLLLWGRDREREPAERVGDKLDLVVA